MNLIEVYANVLPTWTMSDRIRRKYQRHQRTFIATCFLTDFSVVSRERSILHVLPGWYHRPYPQTQDMSLGQKSNQSQALRQERLEAAIPLRSVETPVAKSPLDATAREPQDRLWPVSPSCRSAGNDGPMLAIAAPWRMLSRF